MTTKQTINDVPRELLEGLSALWPEGAGNDGSGRVGWLPHVTKLVQELRALLDADKVNNRKMGLMQFVEAHPIKPAAQPRGEPIYQVMYRGDGGGGWCDAEKDSYDMKVPHPKHWRTRIVYAEPPAPVALVLPERAPGDTEDSDVLSDCRNEGWNACLDELKRLNPSPVEMVTVAEAWEACGGNPGIKATREELLSALRLMNEAEDEQPASVSMCDCNQGRKP